MGFENGRACKKHLPICEKREIYADAHNPTETQEHEMSTPRGGEGRRTWHLEMAAARWSSEWLSQMWGRSDTSFDLRKGQKGGF